MRVSEHRKAAPHACGLVGLLLGSLIAHAQPEQVHRVGFIASTSPVAELRTVNPAARAFARGMQELGYTEGSDLLIEWRSAEGKLERTGDIVRDLVAAKVHVIVTVVNQMTSQAMEVTRSVPIIMAASYQPVEDGLVESLARPGGNVTGLTLDTGPEVVGKRLQLLKELVPGTRRVSIVGPRIEERGARRAAEALGLELVFIEPDPARRYLEAFGALARNRSDALLIEPWAPSYAHRREIADFAAANAIPVMYPSRDYVMVGGLASYGVDVTENFRRSAAYVHRILKGAKPAELPVERPSKFELVLNLKAAKAIGLNIPPTLLLQAQEVVQ